MLRPAHQQFSVAEGVVGIVEARRHDFRYQRMARGTDQARGLPDAARHAQEQRLSALAAEYGPAQRALLVEQQVFDRSAILQVVQDRRTIAMQPADRLLARILSVPARTNR